jgi:hypothetical protein
MTNKSFILKNVVAIAICLAGMAMFSGCDDEENGDNEYTIEYRPGAYSSEQKNYSQSKQAGEPVMLRDATYTRDGFTQTGWSTSEDGDSWDFGLTDEYWDDKSITLYPYWDEDKVPFTGYDHYPPTNVYVEYRVEETTGIANATGITIKIGDYYFGTGKSDAFGDALYGEEYITPNDDDTWTSYSRLRSVELVGPWELKGSELHIRDVHKEMFGFMVADENHILIRDHTPSGKETIVGVQCDKYVFSEPVFTQTFRYTILHDPVTNLFFYTEMYLDETVWSRFEVKVWDKSVTGFGGIDLP